MDSGPGGSVSPAAAEQGRARLRHPVRRYWSCMHRRAALGRQGRADDPNANHLSDTITVDGKREQRRRARRRADRPAVAQGDGKFFLGADRNGRDVMVRLLYGGRNSLLIGVVAAVITTLLSISSGCSPATSAAGSTASIAPLLDVLWSFPVIMLGVALGMALTLGGLNIGPINLAGGSLLIPIFIIGFVYVPYMARPVRGQVLSLREKEFVEAARAQGAGPLPDHVRRGAAEPRLDDPRVLHAADRQRHPARGGAVVPRRRRAAAEPVVGHHDRRGRRPDRHGAAPDDRPGPDARADGARR